MMSANFSGKTLVTAMVGAALLSGCGTLTSINGDKSQTNMMELPKEIEVPTGHERAMVGSVVNGTVTWLCAQNESGDYAWKFAGPSANLVDDSGNQIGSYYGPPATWEALDGSKVTGKQLATAPAGAGNIPFQLVKATSVGPDGMMSDIAYIQRINLVGGAAPATGCTKMSEGRRFVSGYTADYVFWTAE
ncbi:MAG: Protein of unknown function (DUF3455) [Marinobacter excellens HL-55]|uniref:DUF3455 domain-containing protein n=1 Tax=Marinobacter excellens HL-55 TaxID=1305731 RepID=A0A0P8AZI0_9GAMM|nr:MAG: Protein of unknown function (DUF3455) [Marinobacter excellens HL-55]